MNDRVRTVLAGILEQFKTGRIPELVSFAMFPRAENVPSADWSLLNRTAMFLGGTADARGFKQWQAVGRYVKKGEKARIFILIPCFKKRQKEDSEEEVAFLTGFLTKGVFAYEQTEGEPLPHLEIEVPDLPLLERAAEWGLSVKAIPGNFQYRGYYAPGRAEIALASREECVFFHELAHAAHDRLKPGGLTVGQDPLQEITAELAAAALCRIVGKQERDTLGNHYCYIERYAEKIKLSAFSACTRVLAGVEQVLNLILKGYVLY